MLYNSLLKIVNATITNVGTYVCHEIFDDNANPIKSNPISIFVKGMANFTVIYKIW